MKLFTFFQSGSSYRVRILLNLKSIDYEPVFVRGGRGAADLAKPEYLALNPQGVIPTLVDGEHVLTQTLAIAEYLEEAYPRPPLLPTDPAGRAHVRALAQTVVSDCHPPRHRRGIAYLDGELGLDKDEIGRWQHHWNRRGFGAIERMLAESPDTGGFCHGESPTIADACLVSQAYVAGKFGVDMEAYPEIRRIVANCFSLDAFRRAAPENRPDAG